MSTGDDGARGRSRGAVALVAALIVVGCESSGHGTVPEPDEHVGNGLSSACQPLERSMGHQTVVSPGTVVLADGERAVVEVRAVVTEGPADALVGAGIAADGIVGGDRNGIVPGDFFRVGDGSPVTPESLDDLDLQFGPVELDGPGTWPTVVVVDATEPVAVVVPAHRGEELFTLTIGECEDDAA